MARNEDPEPQIGRDEARKRFLHGVIGYVPRWIEKPPLESRDRTLYWLLSMKDQSITTAIKAYEDCEDPETRAMFCYESAVIEQYLTNLDKQIVELRSKYREIMEKVKG